MTNCDVVKKLIGGINPVGDASFDEKRLENLKSMCDLITELVEGVKSVAYHNQFAHEHSIKKASDYARKFLENLEVTE